MRTLFVLLLFIPFLATAQLEANNFIVTSEGRVNWQKVFEKENISFEDLVNTIKSNRRFSDIEVSEGKITCLGSGIETDPRAAGFSRGGTSFYALGTIQAYFTIDYKPGRYRITAVNITSAVPTLQLAPSAYYEDSSKYKQVPLEESVGNGKGLKKSFIKKESLIMSMAIEKEFSIVRNEPTNDDW